MSRPCCRETRNLLEAVAAKVAAQDERIGVNEAAIVLLLEREMARGGVVIGDGDRRACHTTDCTGTVMPGNDSCLKCWDGAKGRDK